MQPGSGEQCKESFDGIGCFVIGLVQTAPGKWSEKNDTDFVDSETGQINGQYFYGCMDVKEAVPQIKVERVRIYDPPLRCRKWLIFQ